MGILEFRLTLNRRLVIVLSTVDGAALTVFCNAPIQKNMVEKSWKIGLTQLSTITYVMLCKC